MLNLIKKIARIFGLIKETPVEKIERLEKEIDDLNLNIYKENQRKIDEMYAAINEAANNLK